MLEAEDGVGWRTSESAWWEKSEWRWASGMKRVCNRLLLDKMENLLHLMSGLMLVMMCFRELGTVRFIQWLIMPSEVYV